MNGTWFMSTDKPQTPVVSTDNSNPTDGDSITLTCTSSTGAVNGYTWQLDGSTISGQTGQTYAIAQADIGTHEGAYTCVALIDTVASDTSSALTVNCKYKGKRILLALFFVLCLLYSILCQGQYSVLHISFLV